MVKDEIDEIKKIDSLIHYLEDDGIMSEIRLELHDQLNNIDFSIIEDERKLVFNAIMNLYIENKYLHCKLDEIQYHIMKIENWKQNDIEKFNNNVITRFNSGLIRDFKTFFKRISYDLRKYD